MATQARKKRAPRSSADRAPRGALESAIGRIITPLDGVQLLDQLLRAGVITQWDLHTHASLERELWSVEREGERCEYLRLQRCDHERELLQKYRPELYARIVAEGQYTPSQLCRLKRKGA